MSNRKVKNAEEWTPRHEFAARAMEIILADAIRKNGTFEEYSSFAEVAMLAVGAADEMLKRLAVEAEGNSPTMT